MNLSKQQHPPTGRRIQSEQSDLTKTTPKTGIKKPHPPHGKYQAWQKNNNKNKTTKHTIEFSNNTPPAAQQDPRLLAAHSLCGRRKNTTEVELPSWTSPRSTD